MHSKFFLLVNTVHCKYLQAYPPRAILGQLNKDSVEEKGPYQCPLRPKDQKSNVARGVKEYIFLFAECCCKIDDQETLL